MMRVEKSLTMARGDPSPATKDFARPSASITSRERLSPVAMASLARPAAPTQPARAARISSRRRLRPSLRLRRAVIERPSHSVSLSMRFSSRATDFSSSSRIVSDHCSNCA